MSNLLKTKEQTTFGIPYAAALICLVVLLIPFFRSLFIHSGLRWLYIFLLSVSLSYLLTPLMRLIALRFKILDHPQGRKIHKNSTPLLGGVAIVIAFTASFVANGVFDRTLAYVSDKPLIILDRIFI